MGKLAIVNAKEGKLMISLPIGKSNDAVVYDAKHSQIFASNGDGTLTVIGLNEKKSYIVLDNVKTRIGARTMAMDPETGKIYLTTAEFDSMDKPTTEKPKPRPKFKARHLHLTCCCQNQMMHRPTCLFYVLIAACFGTLTACSHFQKMPDEPALVTVDQFSVRRLNTALTKQDLSVPQMWKIQGPLLGGDLLQFEPRRS